MMSSVYANWTNLTQTDLTAMPRKRKLPQSQRRAPRKKAKRKNAKKRSSNDPSSSLDGDDPFAKMKLAELKAALKAVGAVQSG